MRTSNKQLSHTVCSNHDFRNLVSQGKRKKFGMHRIRKCVNCDLLERYDTNTLKRVYQAGQFITEWMPACDRKHADIAKELGVDPEDFAKSISAGRMVTGNEADEETARGLAAEAHKRIVESQNTNEA